VAHVGRRYFHTVIFIFILYDRRVTMHELTGFQRDALYVIASHGDPHGLAIKEGLEEYYDANVHHGRLYPNLDTLVEEGMVEKGDRDERTNYYTLTERGERALKVRRKWEERLVDL